MTFLYILYVLLCSPYIVCFAIASFGEESKRMKIINATVCVLLLVGVFFGGMLTNGR